MRHDITIANHVIGEGNRCFLIAEIAQAHDGSLGFAHSYIDLAHQSGADAVKFQVHIADAESTLDEQFRVAFSYVDKTRFDYWKRMEFSHEQWAGLKAHAESLGLVFFASAFSLEAVAMLGDLGVEVWKIASGEIDNENLAKAIASFGKPVLISSGMSDVTEILKAGEQFATKGLDVGIFQCTTEYPTPLEHVGLNVIDTIKARFAGPVGLSDHSGSEIPSIAAISRGAHMIEAHLCFDKTQFGPDTASSLTPKQFHRLSEARDAIHTMLSSPVDKRAMATSKTEMRHLFGKSLVLAKPMKRGDRVETNDLTTKKPGTGIAPERASQFVGKTLRRDVSSERLLREDDFMDE